MHVDYCDLCGHPIKGTNFSTLYCSDSNIAAPDPHTYDNQNEYYRDYANYLAEIEKEVKQICPTCKMLFKKIFEYRLQGMLKMLKECKDIFNIPCKIDTKTPKKRGMK